jgi:hypothetical protein
MADVSHFAYVSAKPSWLLRGRAIVKGVVVEKDLFASLGYRGRDDTEEGEH